MSMVHPSIHQGPNPAGPRRFLVTGVGGFIGSHVAEALVRAGNEVVGVEGFAPSYPRAYKERNLRDLRGEDRFTLVECDLRTAPLHTLMEGVNVVINEAAIAGLPRSWTDVSFYMDANVTALSRLIEASERAGVDRFIQASTSSVYGTYACGDEQQPTEPVSPYGISKLAGEHLVLAHVSAHDLPATILRYFSIYGPRQRPDMAYHIFIEKLRANEPLTIFGDGHQSRSNTFVEDCVEGTVAAVDGGDVGEVYNIGGGVRLELEEAVSILATELEADPVLFHEAPRPGDQRETFAVTAKAAETFGYAPRTDPRTGLAAQVQWHLRQLPRRAEAAVGGRA
jgi:UDP-glucuronate 4-epimerase